MFDPESHNVTTLKGVPFIVLCRETLLYKKLWQSCHNKGRSDGMETFPQDSKKQTNTIKEKEYKSHWQNMVTNVQDLC